MGIFPAQVLQIKNKRRETKKSVEQIFRPEHLNKDNIRANENSVLKEICQSNGL